MSMQLKPIQSQHAPPAVGPYVHAVLANGMVFASGQIPLDPESGEIVGESVADQTRQVLTNLFHVLAAANSSKKHVVRTTVYLTDMGTFAEMNKVYEEMFEAHRPARAAVEVSALPKGARVEIDCIAVPREPA